MVTNFSPILIQKEIDMNLSNLTDIQIYGLIANFGLTTLFFGLAFAGARERDHKNRPSFDTGFFIAAGFISLFVSLGGYGLLQLFPGANQFVFTVLIIIGIPSLAIMLSRMESNKPIIR
jgi:hypothetical protein